MSVGLDIGAVLDGYRIEEVIGRDESSVRYRVEEIAERRPATLRLFSPELSSDPAFRQRVGRESRLVASYYHPNILPVYATGEADQGFYVVTRWVDGQDLEKLIETKGRVQPERAVRIAARVAAALDSAHARSLVHRGLRPASIVIAGGDDEEVFLTDFGATGEGRDGHPIGVPLSPHYAPPEQVQGGDLDGRADVYALGGVLYHALAGRPPFADFPDERQAHLTEPPPGLPGDLAGTSLTAVIQRALAKDPRERFLSAGELARMALDGTGSHGAAEPASASDEEQKGRLLGTWKRMIAAGTMSPTAVPADARAAVEAERATAQPAAAQPAEAQPAEASHPAEPASRPTEATPAAQAKSGEAAAKAASEEQGTAQPSEPPRAGLLSRLLGRTEEEAEKKPTGSAPADAKPADAKAADAKPADAKPADAKPTGAKAPAEEKPGAAKAADAKPADAKPAGDKAATPEPAEPGKAAKAASGAAAAGDRDAEDRERERRRRERQRAGGDRRKGRASAGKVLAGVLIVAAAAVGLLAVAGVFEGDEEQAGSPAADAPAPSGGDEAGGGDQADQGDEAAREEREQRAEERRRARERERRRQVRIGSWPARDAYTAVLYVSRTDRDEARARALKAARGGIRNVGVLRTDNFSQLPPGYWLAFAGQSPTREAAQRTVARARELEVAARPYVVFVNGGR